ncbi:MAG: shikimate dehydrogenase [Christensenellaceae bacterium]|jgi:shikimate 5-dehydrogenase|nr:shikimate dehydrogenase [Christensenellaceae bacterium]
MKVFPEWAKLLGLGDVDIKGIDFPLHAPAEHYREAVEFIANDPLSLGALVTTHKIDLYDSCKDKFDYVDPYARQLNECSSISKKDGRLCAHAKDPISSGLALENFVPANFWKTHGGEVLLMGAGGSSLAITLYLTQDRFMEQGNVPQKITIANRSLPRLLSAEKLLKNVADRTALAYVLGPLPADNDKVMAALPPFSLVVNATGLGKDAPGSPITNQGNFPESSLAWELNYRGNLVFLDQANAQQSSRNLTVEDGWVYFIHGWTQVIAEVFHIRIDDAMLTLLSEAAKRA